ncbi:CAP domain-containing protein [Nonomuraea sp. LPB2021202275-12-8]|uniref:CAP domain-containing protein n=1 Tax=Nonomuraea sp. LPB2021202275-12-8 TaxID=3120159 RepID=UPI00300C1731
MRRPLGVLACLVSAAALSAPVATANAATVPQAVCRVSVAKPLVNAAGKIQASATRRGCGRATLVRVRVKRAVPGTDPVVKSGAKKSRNARVTIALPCAPGVYYTVATDYRGNTGKSRPVRLSCSPTATPSPTATATPSPSPTTTAPPKPSATPTTTTPPAGTVGSAEENEVVRLTNAERAKGGCQPLKHDAQLRKAAFGHSSDMATQNYFSHTSKDGRTFMDRIRGAGFTGGSGWAENIAMGQQTPASVVSAWMNSSGHKANIMNCKYNLIGVGAAKNSKGQIYWTQNFAAR